MDQLKLEMGLRLKRARERKRLTQEQAGRYVGVSTASIGGYETGVATPPADVMLRLCSLYGVTTDYIYGIDNRKTIILDGLTPEQEDKIDIVVKTIESLIKPDG